MSKKTVGKNPNSLRNTIPAMFSHVVNSKGDGIALIADNKEFTYQELDQLSDQLAIHILDFNLPKETRVGIAVYRSAEMIIAILAVLKAGCAYVPIDPNYPTERKKYLLEDSGVKLLLTRGNLLGMFKSLYAGNVLNLDATAIYRPGGLSENQSQRIKNRDVVKNDLAYSIYTSGSTGQPKGVLVEHATVVNLINCMKKDIPHEIDRFLFTYSFSFDGSVQLIWWTLLSGGTLVMAPENLEKDVEQLGTFIKETRITHILTFPSSYQLLLNKVAKEKLGALQLVIVAGEACPGALVDNHFSILPNTRFFNHYGPTETTVCASSFEAFKGHSDIKTPIGKAFCNFAIYIMDDNLNRVEDGTMGEICIGGGGVSRGYHNRPELTKQRFINIEVNGKKDRIYRTGDLGKILPDGNIDFCGRKDAQIKLRGYRIELGEIEVAMRSIPSVNEVVVKISDGTKVEQKLIAYYQLKENAAAVALREELSKKLPDYMLPAIYKKVEAFNLTPAGKVDRINLPEIGNSRPELNNQYVAPNTKLEKYLVEKWQLSLQIEGIGIQDKFFELGGNSLLAAGFISELQQLFNESIFIVTIFENPTIAQYAAMLTREYRDAVKAHFGKGNEPSLTDPETKVLVSNEIKAFINFVPQRKELPSSDPQNDAAIFILAPPRSGTSLLRTMLSGHPEIFGANELQLLHFPDMAVRAHEYQGKFALWKEGLVRTVMEIFEYDADDAKSIIQIWEDQKLDTTIVYAQLKDKLKERYLLDKSPSYALDMNALRAANKTFKNAKFIQLSRHPWSMVDSFNRMHMDQVMYLKEQPFRGKQLAELIWYHSHKNIANFFDEINSDQHISLKYEDLVREPEKQSKRLCQFLNLDFHSDVIAPYKDIEKKMTDGIYKDSKPMGDVNFLEHGKIRADFANGWKQIKDVELNDLSKDQARALNYPFEEQPTISPNPIEKKKEPAEKNIASNDIAIIGMSVRLPGADNIETFWENLVTGKDVSRNFTKEELLAAGVDMEDLDSDQYVKKGMVLADHDCFDEKFFGYTPKEAALMDPQHRIFLEVGYAALENAGINPFLENGKIGVYGAVARNTYLPNNVMTHPQYFDSLDDFQLGIALEKDFPATKLAYKLNLKGPAISVQTACSSSGVALHMACQSLRSGDADVLLVGGGRIQPPVHKGYEFTDGHALSPTGFCHTFDADAQGMVRGQGMAFVVLKPLEKAMEDGDKIHGVIKGSGINNDGADKIGFTAPSANGQSLAIQKAYENANVNPEAVSYIEAHGTGTKLGDPIEIAGLSKAFRQWTDKKQYCAIASVKSNVGHLDAGSCVLGVIKTVLALENEILPKSLHFSKPNPQINFKQSPFYVNDKLREWPRTNKPRYAGVSALGLGGTNAHIVLSEAPIPKTNHTPTDNFQLITLSAKTPDALKRQEKQLADFLKERPALDLKSLGYTLNSTRNKFQNRSYFVGNSVGDLIEQLEEGEGIDQSSLRPKDYVFLFPGGGAQHENMGLHLYQTEIVFKKTVDEALAILLANHGYDFSNILYPKGSEERKVIEDPLAGITLLFIVEYACAKLWHSWGIHPKAMIGHSLGEYTAACLAEVFTLEDALKMVVARGELFRNLPEGGMLSIALPPDEVKVLVGDRLDIAAINRPDHCVVSGSKESIDIVKAELNQLEIHATKPKIKVAAHSREIEFILNDFRKVLETIKFSKPNQALISNVRGDWAGEDDFSNIEYWLNHLRGTVLFSDGIEKVFDADNHILIEVGPNQTLATFARQHAGKPHKQQIVATLPHPKESSKDDQFLLNSIGKLWQLDSFENWAAFYQQKRKTKISLPTYPFARNRHWIESKKRKPANLKNQNFPVMGIQSGNSGSGSPPLINRQSLILAKLKELFNEMSGIPVTEMSNKATFLEMGFDSLFLTQAVSKIKKQYKVKLSFRQLFDDLPNLGTLSQWMDGAVSEDFLQDELRKANSQVSLPNRDSQSNESANFLPPINTINPNPIQNNSFAFPSLQPGAQGDIAKIIEQQLQLMQQQLMLLGGTPQVNGAADQSNVQTKINTNPSNESLGKTLALNANDKVSDAPQKNVVDAGAFREINKGSGQKSRRISSWNDLNERETKYLKELIENYTTKTKGSQNLTASQRKHLSDPRSISGFNPIWKDMIYQIAMVRSKGSKMWDIDGNEYIDFRSSFGCNLFGHSPDFIQDAIKNQLEKGFELGALTPLAKEVADLLCELSGMERITILNTGSEALSASVRAARTVSGRDKIAVFEGDYHGIADELLVRSVNRKGKSTTVPVAPGIPSSLPQNVIVLHYDDPNVLQVIEENAADLAAILIEPIQPNNPSFQPRELIHQIRKITETHEIAMIFDEMITGFRVAPRGAQEWYDVEVDMVAYGKVISGGLPMAALAGKSKYLDAFDGGQWQFGDDSSPPAGVTFFGGTFVKHPLGLASSLAALKAIQKGGKEIFTQLNDKSERFARSLAELFDRTKAPLKVASTASIICIKAADGNPFVPLFFFYCQLKGLHIASKAILLTLSHTQEELDSILKMFEEIIGEMQTAGFFPITLRNLEIKHEIIAAPANLPSPKSATTPIVKVGEKIILPLTPGQKEIWIEQRLGDQAAAAYNLAGRIDLAGKIDQEILTKSIHHLALRHPALRVKFNFDEPTQTISPDFKLDLKWEDISHEKIEIQDDILKAIEEEEGSVPFDLFNGPLIRFRLVKKSGEAYVLIMNAHHGIADGWSCGILAKELSIIYTAFSRNKSLELSPAKSYVEFIKEETNFLNSEEYLEQEEYWKTQFEAGSPILEFPTDAPRPAKKTYTADLERIQLDEALIARLKKKAAKEGTTLFILLYNAYRIFIHRLTGQNDFVLGLVAAAQTIAGNENLVTHGVNLLPVRNKVNPKAHFSDDLKNTRNLVLDAFENQQYSLGALVQSLKEKRDPSRQPIISFLFNMDAEGDQLDFNGIPGKVNPIQRKYETFDTFINVKAIGKRFDFEWIFNTDLFNNEMIRIRLEEFKTLLVSIASESDQLIGELEMIPTRELELKKSWKSAIVPREKNKTFLDYFRDQVEKRPSQVAIFFGKKSLTYQQLEEDSNRLAHRLVQVGTQKGDHVGIYFQRSMEMIISLIACYKVGAIYVPLDPINPVSRIQFLLEDVEAKFLLTHHPLIERQPTGNWKSIWLSGPNSDWKNAPSENINKTIFGDDLAYVIYTSGSSGKPKSVHIPHHALVDHHLAMQDAIGVEEKDHILSIASIAFDPSVQDYFLPLMIGAQVTLAMREEQLDGRLLGSLIERRKITIMQATPATWRLLLLSGWDGSKRLTILSGGEGLNRTFADKLLNRCARLFNIYGPTETTIWSTTQEVKQSLRLPSVSGFEPVGFPMQNVQLYLLDDNQVEVPIGAKGELYVGGVGVAPFGYHKRADLNKIHFVKSPFNPKETLYRTGDLARYLLNGSLEFLGRKDGQVKIRGHRIEVGEVETFLAKTELFKENVVVAKKNPSGEKSLVAYVTLTNGKPLDVKDTKQFLQKELPDYMVPSYYVTLKEFPLTSTLKVDRKRLPEPDWGNVIEKLDAKKPQTDTEKVLYRIWKEILHLENLGVQDDFFELGGHSLIAVEMMAKIEAETGKRLPLSALLENPQIESLSQVIEGKKESQFKGSMVPIRESGSKPPIYLVHGAGLHVLMYQTLSEHMCPEQPIFGFQARGLYGEAEPLDRIEHMAAAYIEEILERNPHGPYALAGYSFGGLITFEMGKQLKAMGKEVVMLGMFDTVVRPEITGENTSSYTSLKRIGKKMFWNFGALAKDPIHNFKYKSNTISRRLKRLTFSWTNKENEQLDENDVNRNMALLDQKNQIAFENYRITPFDGKLHLFRAKIRRFWMEDFEFLGWKPFANKGIVVHEVPGDHLQLFDMPYGKEFAKILQSVLDRVFAEAEEKKK